MREHNKAYIHSFFVSTPCYMKAPFTRTTPIGTIKGEGKRLEEITLDIGTGP